ncbi:MAG: DUF5666 domain-containing protein [Candidatus Nomurabacteria bacterium]|nr:DUF5666 domain-containing protein [Candidatus Nomurabacteria bacterium]
MKNKKIIFVVVGIIVLAGVFYGGMTYGKSQTSTQNLNGFSANMQNRTGQFGANGRTGGNRGGGGFVGGEIISKDDKSITVKIMNNDPTATNTISGSKIIFFDTSTTVSKTATGSLTDLAVGTQVSVQGTTNSDGSVTAKTIQIRPLVRPTIPTQ